MVDDDPQTLWQVRETLSEAGYRPIVAAEPQEALRLAAQGRLRLILLDMMLPGADGIELMRDLSAVSRAPVELTAKEYDLRRVLPINAGQTLTHEQVLQQVWAPGKGDVRALRSLLLRLRHKLGEEGGNPTWIFSVPRIGYRMAEPEASRRAGVGQPSPRQSRIGPPPATTGPILQIH